MIKEELRKIWRPGMLMVLIVMGAVYYMMFMEFYIRFFPNGPHYEGEFDTARQMKEAYGTSISEEEMADFVTCIPLLQKEADRYVADSEAGRRYGLKTYEQYGEFRQKIYEDIGAGEQAADKNENYADCMILDNYLQSEATDNIEGRLYAACLFEAEYRRAQELEAEWEGEEYSRKEQEHARQLFFGKDKKWQNILPWEVIQAAGAYGGRLLVWVCLSVCLLLSPLMVHDRMAGMRPLQYSSRHGRKIYRSQLAAVMLSAFLLTTVNIVLFGGIFASNGTAVFFPCRMYSFMGTQYSWPDWTHGTWCLALAVMCYLTAAGTAGAVFFLSKSSTNYVGMMLKMVPLFIALAVLCPKMTEDAFYYQNELYRYTGIPYIEFICAAALTAAGAFLCWYGAGTVRKESA